MELAGMFDRVMNYEVNEFRMACHQMQADGRYNPKITYVVVQKRHRTRIFSTENVDVRSKNCVPGFVIDQGITSATKFDFFLMSHAGIKGTSRPAHYHVLHDENTFSSDQIQALTFQVSCRWKLEMN